jgi:GTP-binding protein
LLDRITAHLHRVTDEEQSNVLTLALLGRPNVGKSSLLNALVGKAEAIVSATSGTTRDVRAATLEQGDTTIQLLDTAGLRRRGKIESGVEKFSVIRTGDAIDSCDVAILVMDATELGTAGDQHIAGMVKDAGKGLILVVNKWDLPEKDDKTQARVAKRLAADFQFVWWAPLVFTSATTGLNVKKLLELATEIHQRRQQAVATPKLNRTVEELVRKHPPAGLKRLQPKINYATQTGSNPPEFTFFASHHQVLHFSYPRYLENGLRQAYDFAGTPIALIFRSKRRGE